MPLPDVKIIISGVDRFSRTIGKSLKGLDRLGRKTMQVGKNITRNVTLPIIGLGIAAAASSLKINESMANIGTLIPGNIARLRFLKKEIQALGIETGRSQIDIAEGVFQQISAFGDSVDVMDKVRIAARAGVAGRSQTIESFNLLTSVTKAFNKTTKEATQHVANLAFKTNELGQTTFAEMAESMGKIAPLASTLNVKMEEMFGVMATGTGVTGNTSMVATQLASVFGALLKPNKDMEIAFKKLGVASGRELIQQKGLQGSLKALQVLSEKYSETSLAKLLGRKEAMTLAFALNNELADVFTEKLGKMNNVVGAAETAFKEQTEGINEAGFAFNQFITRVVILASKIGDKLVPHLLKFGRETLIPILSKLEKLDDQQIQWILRIGGLLSVIGPLLVILGFLASAIAKIVGVVMKLAPWIVRLAVNIFKFGKFLAGLTPLTKLIILAFTIWIHNIIQIIKHWEDLTFIFSFWWKKIAEGFKGMVDKTVKFLEPLIEKLSFIGGLMKNIGLGIARFVLPKGLEEKFGISEGGGENRQALERVSATNINRNEFKGKLTIEGAPPRSKIEVERGGEMEIETDTGLIPVGVTG